MINHEITATPEVCRALRTLVRDTTNDATRIDRGRKPSRAELAGFGLALLALCVLAWGTQ